MISVLNKAMSTNYLQNESAHQPNSANMVAVLNQLCKCKTIKIKMHNKKQLLLKKMYIIISVKKLKVFTNFGLLLDRRILPAHP